MAPSQDVGGAAYTVEFMSLEGNVQMVTCDATGLRNSVCADGDSLLRRQVCKQRLKGGLNAFEYRDTEEVPHPNGQATFRRWLRCPRCVALTCSESTLPHGINGFLQLCFTNISVATRGYCI